MKLVIYGACRRIVAAVLVLMPAALWAQSSGSRYNKEFVFPLHINNISIGASPVIMRGFMLHDHPGADIAVKMPPVHIMAEHCAWDFGNAGSIGTGAFISYGRYTYSYDGEDGRGGNRINVRTGMTHILAGVSYHYTVLTRLEAYTRLMFGAGISGYNSDREGATHNMNAKIIWNGVVGMRYFFSNSFGVYAEGGYTSGCVNVGITYRW
jgi:hypothetical protein